MKILLLILSAVFSAAVLTEPTLAQGNTADLPNQGASPSVLGYIETRNWKIAIKSGGVYTVYASGGTVLAEDITREQLQARFPNLHKILEDGVIGKPIDASIN